MPRDERRKLVNELIDDDELREMIVYQDLKSPLTATVDGGVVKEERMPLTNVE